jgi:hypothetical protein
MKSNFKYVSGNAPVKDAVLTPEWEPKSKMDSLPMGNKKEKKSATMKMNGKQSGANINTSQVFDNSNMA